MANPIAFYFVTNQALKEKIHYKRFVKIKAIPVGNICADPMEEDKVVTAFIDNDHNLVETKFVTIKDDYLIHNINNPSHKYVINKSTLNKLYNHVSDNIYSPKETPRVFYQIPDNIKFLSAWEEIFNLKSGGVIFEMDGGFSGINPEEFKKHYQIISTTLPVEPDHFIKAKLREPAPVSGNNGNGSKK